MSLMIEESNILVVEPHADDAILSVYDYMTMLIKAGNNVSMVTVSTRETSNSRAYCDFVGATFVESDNIEDINFKQNRLPFGAVRNAGDGSFQYQINHYCDKHADTLAKIVDKFADLFGEYQATPDLILLPLGIYHPFHVLTHVALTSICDTYKLPYVLYVDLPYGNKEYGKTIIKSASQQYPILREKMLDEAEVKQKLYIFRKLYPGESIHWDEPGMYKNPEILMGVLE